MDGGTSIITAAGGHKHHTWDSMLFSYSNNLNGWLWEDLALLIWVCSILQKFLCYTDKAEERCTKEWCLSKVVHAVNSHTYGSCRTKSINETYNQSKNILKCPWGVFKPFLRTFSTFATFFSIVYLCRRAGKPPLFTVPKSTGQGIGWTADMMLMSHGSSYQRFFLPHL